MDKEDIEQAIKYKRYINRYMIIFNSIVIICMTILSIVFNKWWIVFFSILFLSSLSKDEEKKEDWYMNIEVKGENIWITKDILMI